MKLHLNREGSLQLITAYSAGRITVGEIVYRSSLIITPDKLIPDWGKSSPATLDETDFAMLRDLAPEVVLLGTGSQMQFPSPAITVPLVNESIGLEVMDTAAACRTYNILAGEGREVAAALIIQ